MRQKVFFISILTAGLCISCAPSKKFLLKKKFKNPVASENIRVLILKTKNRINIKTGSRIKISTLKSRKKLYSAPRGNVHIYPDKIKEPVLIESWESHISVNGKKYRGTMELHNFLGSLQIVNVVNIEEYLYSVVPSEIPASWHTEALKAQAVAARTYTYYHLEKRNAKSTYDVDATTNFQMYKGVTKENPSATAAVKETRGTILTYRHEPIISFFHSTCGGKTIDDKFVWGNEDLPYLKSVHSDFCQESPHYTWKSRISIYQIKSALKKKYQNIGAIRGISFKKVQGRVFKVRIKHKFGTVNITGNEFRLLFQSKTIKSTYFNAKKSGKSLVLYGRGWGHGVGLCQWSAKGMAEKGFTYKRILNYFYRNTRMTHVKKSFAKNTRNYPLKHGR